MAKMTYHLTLSGARAKRTRCMKKARQAVADGNYPLAVRHNVRQARLANRQIIALLRHDSVADRRLKPRGEVT